ncbi:hypothetical protein HN51_069912, partial [Arachis hypogaea]
PWVPSSSGEALLGPLHIVPPLLAVARSSELSSWHRRREGFLPSSPSIVSDSLLLAAKQLVLVLVLVQVVVAVCIGFDVGEGGTQLSGGQKQRIAIADWEFNLKLHTVRIIASSFGLANLFSRPGGGFISDAVSKRFGMRGRLWALWLCQTFAGVLCIILGLVGSLSVSVVVMIIFSVFVQATCGMTFGIVPFVSRRALCWDFGRWNQIRMSYMAAARRNLNDPENAIIGAFAGALTGAITTPLDVIKTRLMVQGSANQYNGIVDCVQTIIKEEGPSALLKVLLFQHMNDLVLENICDRVRKAGMMKKKQQQKEQVK